MITLSLRFARQLRRYLSARANFIKRVKQLDFSPVLPPWSQLLRDNSEISQLRRLSVSTLWMYVTSRLDRLILLLLACAWPVRVRIRAIHLTWSQRGFVEAEASIPPVQQWRAAVRAAGKFNYSPAAYFKYRFFENAHPLGSYLQEMELGLLLKRINQGAEMLVLPDKVRFFDECTRLQLPTPPVIAIFSGGLVERWIAGDLGVLPRHDLFLKDAAGQQGRGVERWDYHSNTEQWTRHDLWYRHNEMLAHCRLRGSKSPLIVQPVVRNHRQIRHYAPQTLCTLRVMSCYDPREDSKPTLIRACFKMGRNGSEVDNLHAGGLACALNVANGTLGIARGNYPSDGSHTHHPDTGAEISGQELPYWRESIYLALLAHELLPGLPWSVGWDIAVSSDGPLLLEGNSIWASDLAQAPRPEPFDADFIAQLLVRLRPSLEQVPSPNN